MNMEKKYDYDIIVAGAGMSGSLAAAMAARRGYRVAILDRNKEGEAGKKTNWGWVCGDAVAEDHLNYIKSMVDLRFDHPELDNKVDAVVAYSPDMQSSFKFEGSGYVLNRPLFEDKTLKYAIKSGAEYMPQFEVEGPIIENDYIAGIFGKDKDMKHVELRAKIVIDALGIATTIRRKLPDSPYVTRSIDINDVESTGRYLYDFELDHEDKRYYDPKVALIHLNQEVSPGGYGWVFPKSGGNKVNVGIGVQKASLEERNRKLGKSDTLHTLMEQYAKSIPTFKSLTQYDEGHGSNQGKGYWSVAVRRQIENLVYNGYMGAGDSMVMPNPISAGGIGPAMVSGLLAGKNAADALEKGDFSMGGLWQYNLDYNKNYGYKTAGMEVFRIYLQSLNNEVLNYGFKNFLSKAEAEDLSYGRVTELSLASKLLMVLKGAANISAFRNLLYVVKKMKELNEIYAKYPQSPSEFLEWKKTVVAEIEDAKGRFKPSPI